MKRFLMLAIWGLAMFSCQQQKENGTSFPVSAVSFTFHQRDMTVTTKSLSADQENEIEDINLYLFHRTFPDITRHLFLSGSQTKNLSLTLPLGEYCLYAVANLGFDLGDKTEPEVQDSQIVITGAEDLTARKALPMCARKTFTVQGQTNLSVTLERIVSKISLTVSVAPELAGTITLKGVQIENAPKVNRFFSTNGNPSAGERIVYPLEPAEGNRYTATLYLLENAAGENPAITDQRQKNTANAPGGATRIRITATSGNTILDYRVFPGENNTTDFNIVRNKEYRLNIAILGTNSVDTRVSSTSVYCNGFEYADYKPGQSARAILSVSAQNNAEPVFLSYRIVEGAGTVAIGGVSRPEGIPFQFTDGEDWKEDLLTYRQDQAGAVGIDLTVSDGNGLSATTRISTVYKNDITLTATKPTVTTGGSTSNFMLTVSETGYSGTFDISCSILTGGGVIRQNGIEGNRFSMSAGNRTISYTPSVGGENHVRITVADKQGQQAYIDVKIEAVPQEIFIRCLRQNEENYRNRVSITCSNYPLSTITVVCRIVTQLCRHNGQRERGRTFETTFTVGPDILGEEREIYRVPDGTYAGEIVTDVTVLSMSKQSDSNGLIRYTLQYYSD